VCGHETVLLRGKIIAAANSNPNPDKTTSLQRSVIFVANEPPPLSPPHHSRGVKSKIKYHRIALKNLNNL